MASLLGAGKWPRAVILGLPALGLAIIAVQTALTQALPRARPDFVLGITPDDPAALNTQFQRDLNKGTITPAQLHQWSTRARDALRSAPLEVGMLRILAADPSALKPQELLGIAETISRRDALLQLALIENAVAAGRIDQALAHYDRALSIYPDMRSLLFPILTEALAEPDIRRELTRLTRRNRSWVNAFLAHAVRQSSNPANVAALLAEIDRTNPPMQSLREHEATLAGRFITNGDYTSARRLARLAAKDDPGAIDRTAFSSVTWETATRPLTWTRAETDGVDAQLIDNNSILATVRPGGAGLALFRVLVRDAGHYRFSVDTAVPPDGGSPAKGRWELLCLRAHTTQTLSTVRVDPATATSASAVLTVPDNCAALRLDFHLDNVDGGDEAGMMLRNVALEPIGSLPS